MSIYPPILTFFSHYKLVWFESERAWAHAMMLKEKANSVVDPKQMKLHNTHCKKRLRKSLNHSKRLLEFCNLSASDSLKLEAKAYFFYIQGIYEMECKRWPESESSFLTSKNIYNELASMTASQGKSNPNSMDHATWFESRAKSLDASIAFCKLHLNKASSSSNQISSLPISNPNMAENLVVKSMLLSEHQQDLQNRAATMKTFSWLNIDIPVDTITTQILLLDAREKILNLSKAAQSIDKSKPVSELSGQFQSIYKLYDDVLITLSDSIDRLNQVSVSNNSVLNQDINHQLTLEFLSFLHSEISTSHRLAIMEEMKLFTKVKPIQVSNIANDVSEFIGSMGSIIPKSKVKLVPRGLGKDVKLLQTLSYYKYNSWKQIYRAEHFYWAARNKIKQYKKKGSVEILTSINDLLKKAGSAIKMAMTLEKRILKTQNTTLPTLSLPSDSPSLKNINSCHPSCVYSGEFLLKQLDYHNINHHCEALDTRIAELAHQIEEISMFHKDGDATSPSKPATSPTSSEEHPSTSTTSLPTDGEENDQSWGQWASSYVTSWW